MLKEDNLDFKNEYLYEVEARGILIKEYIGKEQRVTIPEIIENKKVTKIASEAFEGKNLLEVNMPDTIKEIGKYAFASNMYLEHIKLSSNLKSIPEGGFEHEKINYKFIGFVVCIWISAYYNVCRRKFKWKWKFYRKYKYR